MQEVYPVLAETEMIVLVSPVDSRNRCANPVIRFAALILSAGSGDGTAGDPECWGCKKSVGIFDGIFRETGLSITK